MNEESYSFSKEPDIFYYEFFSEGPNGRIRKVVQFQQISNTMEIYNLGFGDFNLAIGALDDMSVSNNLDTQKVLATVSKTLIDFMNQHSNAFVIAKGQYSGKNQALSNGHF
jgi:hypothetical protein